MALTMQSLAKLVKTSFEYMITISIAILVTIEICVKYIFGRVRDLMSRSEGYHVGEWFTTEYLNYIKMIFGDGEGFRISPKIMMFEFESRNTQMR